MPIVIANQAADAAGCGSRLKDRRSDDLSREQPFFFAITFICLETQALQRKWDALQSLPHQCSSLFRRQPPTQEPLVKYN
jgi:hypothetical protein